MTETIRKPWYKQKTTWTAITTIIGSIGGVVSGTLPVVEALILIAPSVQFIFQRQATENNK